MKVDLRAKLAKAQHRIMSLFHSSLISFNPPHVWAERGCTFGPRVPESPRIRIVLVTCFGALFVMD